MAHGPTTVVPRDDDPRDERRQPAYHLDGGEPLTLKEVGRRLGFNREWVRKIELRAIAKLRVDDEIPA